MIGAKIRTLRLERKLTIEQLARAAGLTMGFISQVERGLANLSLVSLRQICRALDVPLFQMFLDGQEPDEYITRGDRRARIRFPDHKVQYELLSPSLNSNFQVMEVVLGPGEATSDEPMSHRGEEVAVVLAGEVEVTYGTARHTLGRGDAIQIVSTIPHKYANTKRAVSRVLMAILNTYPHRPMEKGTSGRDRRTARRDSASVSIRARRVPA
jgi:transcriptional regulator with XRE-family HTH domain